jgi:hypothetical protein
MSFAGEMPSFAAPLPIQMGDAKVARASFGNDRGLSAVFFVEDEYQPFQSELEGRAIYKPVTKVHIFAPGNKSDIIKHVQMEDTGDCPSHPHRFPHEWQKFLAQQEQAPDGTPLEMCKFIPSHRVKELKTQGIHTAEQFAQIPDTALHNFGMDGRRLRDLCKTYVSDDDSKVREMSALQAKNTAMQTDMEMLKQQLKLLKAIF